MKYLFYAAALYVAYRALILALNWKANQNAADRLAAEHTAHEQTTQAKYGMVGGIVAGVGGVVSGIGGIFTGAGLLSSKKR